MGPDPGPRGPRSSPGSGSVLFLQEGPINVVPQSLISPTGRGDVRWWSWPRLTSRISVFRLLRDDFIPTELEVTETGHGGGSAVALEIVAATGEEICCHRVPEGLKRRFSAEDPNSTVMTLEKVRGQAVPI